MQRLHVGIVYKPTGLSIQICVAEDWSATCMDDHLILYVELVVVVITD